MCQSVSPIHATRKWLHLRVISYVLRFPSSQMPPLGNATLLDCGVRFWEFWPKKQSWEEILPALCIQTRTDPLHAARQHIAHPPVSVRTLTSRVSVGGICTFFSMWFLHPVQHAQNAWQVLRKSGQQPLQCHCGSLCKKAIQYLVDFSKIRKHESCKPLWNQLNTP